MNTKSTSRIISKERPRVFVGLSGGVDSAVSAALLKEQGYDVTGVFIKVWQPDFLVCTWREDRREAMRVAAKLDIPFFFFDFEDEYRRGVADYMIAEYKAGRTPNPDVLCNKEIKFGAFLKKSLAMGADFIATGHYARVENGKLLEGADKEKDQSYFLWMLKPEDLSKVLFPVGHLEKSEVRELAEKFGLPNSHRKDSQGICFLGDVDLEEFLSHFVSTKSGKILDTEGRVIGRHKGALYYTLGERHGFEIKDKGTDSKPFYVVAKDMKKNTITVSNNPLEIATHAKDMVTMKDSNWISQPKKNLLEARIRYRQKKFGVAVEGNKVTLKEPQTVALGQSIVFYEDEVCLGGGIVT